jgi:hypothetical protein
MRGDLLRLTPSDVDRFLCNHDYYCSHMAEFAQDGRADAVETLHRFIGELVRQPRRQRSAAGRRLRSRPSLNAAGTPIRS